MDNGVPLAKRVKVTPKLVQVPPVFVGPKLIAGKIQPSEISALTLKPNVSVSLEGLPEVGDALSSVTKTWDEIIRTHDVDHLKEKIIMVNLKGVPTRVFVVGGGLTQIQVRESMDGPTRRVSWSALIGYVT